tara:strand:- start:80 stop:526 length:447 start_codon:yes stop_codon:yes gene_type:complete
MALLIFKADLNKELTTSIAATKTDADLVLVHGGNPATISTIEITDAEYDNLLDGTKKLIMNNQIPSFEDIDWTPVQVRSQQNLEDNIAQYREELSHYISTKSTHSELSKLTDALNFINTLDPSSYSYPTDDLNTRCKAAGKYVNLACI